MIHKIAIENFFSIAERQELDFKVPGNEADLICFRDSSALKGQRLPVIVAIYGPNASGKSTVLRAITATATFFRSSFASPPNNPIPFFNPFAQKDWMSRPTKIQIDFDGQHYGTTTPALFRYDLHIENEPQTFAKEVSYESLSYAPHGKFRRIFERNRQSFVFEREFGIKDSDTRIQSIRPNAST